MTPFMPYLIRLLSRIVRLFLCPNSSTGKYRLLFFTSFQFQSGTVLCVAHGVISAYHELALHFNLC